MKKLLKFAWVAGCIVLLVAYIIACCSAFIPPIKFSYISLFGLAFPILFLAIIVCCIISFFVSRGLAIVLLVAIPFGFYNASYMVALNAKKDWQVEKDSNTLRILTWNVQSFRGLFPQSSPFAKTRIGILNTITQYQPDVLCMQEYKNTENGKKNVSVRKELDSLGYHYYYCSNDDVTYVRDAIHTAGVAIYSKYPLMDTGRVLINPESRREHVIYADVAFNNKKVRLFTAHLNSFYLYPDTIKASDAGEDIFRKTYHRKRVIQYKLRETEVDHNHEVAEIRPLIDQSPYPTVYCGDINTTPASYNYHTLKGENMQDAFLAKGSGLGRTFYQILPTLRIDVCLVSKQFNVQQAQVIERKLSDHYPVIADVKWK